jgi:hypothetical protein
MNIISYSFFPNIKLKNVSVCCWMNKTYSNICEYLKQLFYFVFYSELINCLLFSYVLKEPVIVTAPTEPLCLEIKKPKDQCWTVCTCSCAWVEKYESQKNLTHDELVEAQQEDIQQIQSELKVRPCFCNIQNCSLFIHFFKSLS